MNVTRRNAIKTALATLVAAHSPNNEAMAATNVDRATLIDWVQRFIRFPSEHSVAMERTPAVQSFINQCARPLIESLGLSTRRDGLGNLIAEVGAPGAPLAVAVFAYAMTHPRARMKEPFRGDVMRHPDGERIRGRGVTEQKGAMAASLAAFVEFARNDASRRRAAWILLAAGETGRHDAIASALEALGSAPPFAVLAAGSGGAVSIGNRGRLDVELTIHGQIAHSSTPWLGADVTGGVQRILQRTAAIDAGLPRDESLGPAGLTCTSIRTGPATPHTLQAEAVMTFDRRLLPQEDVDSAFETIRSAFEVDGKLKVKVSRGAFMHAYALSETSGMIPQLLDAISAHGLPRPRTYYSNGALDGGYLFKHGCQAVMWGPGDPGMFHTDDEYVLVDDVLRIAHEYRIALSRLATLT